MYEVTIKQSFSAAHALREIGGTCEKLHGHNFTVEVSLSSQKLTETGILIDFRLLKEWISVILKELDHKYLNKISYFSNCGSSSENIAKFIYDNILVKAKKHNLNVSRVTVWESEEAKVSYTGNIYD